MGRFSRLAATTSVACVLGLLCISGVSHGAEYDEDVNESIPAGMAFILQMQLENLEYVHLDLHVSGVADFHFLDSTQYGRWSIGTSFNEMEGLSALGVSEIDLTDQVTMAGKWSSVIENNGLSTLTLTGHVTASISSAFLDDGFGAALGIVIIIVVAIVVVIIVYFLMHKPKPQQNQMMTMLGPQMVGPDVGMQFCPTCGARVAVGAVNCPACGRVF